MKITLVSSLILCLGAPLLCSCRLTPAKTEPTNIAPTKTASIGLADDALIRESNYIADASFTEQATNHGAVHVADQAYGAINDVRIAQSGADWVRPGEGAVASIGLMAAAKQLKATGHNIGKYDRVLDAFFQTWLLSRKQSVDTKSGDADYGGITERIYYDTAGRRLRVDNFTVAVTGQMISAMWKYYEYKKAIGQTATANAWLQNAWSLADNGGQFINKCYNPTYKMVKANAGASDLWLSDSTMALVAMRCLNKWASTAKKTQSFDYNALADNLATGLQNMKDPGAKWHNFYKVRLRSENYKAGYGDSVDQLCFLPYETNALDPGENYARQISDWWTNGVDELKMTPQTTDSSDWQYYGTRWHWFWSGSPDNSKLYPGPGLQLAKIEWKFFNKTGDTTAKERAIKRYQWAASKDYSDLWLGANGVVESGVPNGVMDWRDSDNRANTAGQWERFVDTSAYFIEVTLMVNYNTDTKYVPD